MSELTDRQTDVLRFINKHRDAMQCNPTIMEITQHFGWASPNAAQDHIHSMERKNVLAVRGGKARGYIVAYPYSEMT